MIKIFRHAYIIKNPVVTVVLALRLSEVLHSICDCDFSEIYACSPWTAPSDSGHTFQANHSCLCYNYSAGAQRFKVVRSL